MFRIVAVDDDPAEIYLLREALLRMSTDHVMTVFGDAESASKHLQSGTSQAPNIILLDLHLPGMSGLDLLRDLKKDEKLRAIPVVVISTSTDPLHITSAYDSHASCYVVKRMNAEDHICALLQLIDFWSRTAKLPGHEDRRSAA